MRIRVFLLALVGALCVCLPLSGAEDTPFSVGIFAFQDDSASMLELVGDALSTYANQFVLPSVAYGDFLAGKLNAERESSHLASITLAYASKSEQALKKAGELQPESTPSLANRLAITYREIPYEEGYARLLESYPKARPWFASRENLDAIVFVKTSKIASNDRLRLYWYDPFSDTTTVVFDQVVVRQDQGAMQEALGKALLSKTAGPGYALLIFDDYSSSVSIEANGEMLNITGRQALVPSGEYSLSLGGELYVPTQLSLKVLPNSITHVPSSLKRLEAGDIRLFSTLGKVNWYVDGSFEDYTGALSISSSMVPLVIVAQKQGFASKTLQVQKPVKEIGVTLHPQWMASPSLVREEQTLFYTSLRNTLLFFGLYVASTTLSETFDVANPLWQSLQVATSGFAIVSTLHTIMNLASYVALASSGVR
ncbi:MAG: hypothetical protein EOM68_02880 [Spirochaetia bacterium]|nr:hypothetical protein [Spirochaetia bacterium]